MKLFQHQKEGIAFLKETKRAILADEMGLGKTRQAIIAAHDSSELCKLVICPASLKINWEREIHIVYPDDEVFIVQSGPEQDIPDVNWIVINYDMLGKYADQLAGFIKHGQIDTGIVDEAHYIKGKSIRADETIKLLKDLENVYMLTGTPIMNRPIELFNILKGIKHPLSKVRTVYAKQYCGAQLKNIVQDLFTGKRFFVDSSRVFPFRAKRDRYRVMTFLDEGGATRLPELRREISGVFLRRTKKEVLDLPDKIVSVQVCELSPEAWREYHQAWEKYLEWVSNHPNIDEDKIENILSAQHLIELGKLKQVCSLAKLENITADVKNAVDQEQKVIIFSQYTQTIKQLANQIGLEVKCVTLTGADDSESRQKSVDEFTNDPNTKVFIGNIKAAGVGLNLTSASIVIFADMDWSPAIHQQAEDRAHRIGQEGTVNVYYYVAKDTIEEDIVDILGQKREIIQQIMDGKKIRVSAVEDDLIKRLSARLGKTH